MRRGVGELSRSGVLGSEEPSHLPEQTTGLWRRCRRHGAKCAFERGGEVGDPRVPVARLPSQPFHDHAFHLVAKDKSRHRLIDGCRWLGEQLGQHFPGGTCRVRVDAGKQEVRDRSQAVLVSRGPHQHPTERLRRHVQQRANEEPVSREPLVVALLRFGSDAEIEQAYAVVDAVVHEVLGLQIAVDDPLPVRCVDRSGNLSHDACDLLSRKRAGALGDLLQQFAGRPLDRQVPQAIHGAKFDRTYDVGVHHAQAKLRLPLEAGHGRRVISQFRAQDLQRHDAVRRMRRAINHRRPAFAYHVLHRIFCDDRSNQCVSSHGDKPTCREGRRQALEPSARVATNLALCVYRILARAGSLHTGYSRASAADVMALQVRQLLGRGRRLAQCLVVLALSACASGRPPGGPPSAAPGPPAVDAPPNLRRGDLAAQSDVLKVLQGLGLLANGLPLPFTGSIATLPGPVADSTLVVVSLSFPSIAFAFTREEDRFRATYVVAVEARRNGSIVAHVESNQTVRVVSFKETQRTDESILFQQQLLIPPGEYTIAVLVKDGGTSRSGTQEKLIELPRFGDRPSTPIIALEVQPRTTANVPPELLANSRNTIVLGRDSELPLYIEVRDSAPSGVPLKVAIRDDKGAALWQDSVVLPNHGKLASGVIRVPVAGLGVGIVQAAVWRAGSGDVAVQPVLISFGDDLPVASFDEMITYLRFFASSARLSTLKTGTPQQRAEAWATFLRETDPISITPQNEALRDYFQRIRVANERFKEDAAAGWLSDRGSTFVAFGEPDQILDQNQQGQQDLNVGQRNRLQAWDYTGERLRLIFIDQSGFGRWRFYGNGSNDFATALQRRLNR